MNFNCGPTPRRSRPRAALLRGAANPRPLGRSQFASLQRSGSSEVSLRHGFISRTILLLSLEVRVG
jgi:hypothetical protein